MLHVGVGETVYVSNSHLSELTQYVAQSPQIADAARDT